MFDIETPQPEAASTLISRAFDLDSDRGLTVKPLPSIDHQVAPGRSLIQLAHARVHV
jgi:hypothetical protein